MQPLLSIIVPCYNHGHYVQDCIYSIINQDYQNIELIIIDDGSKDDSVQKIEEMRPLCEKRFVRFEFRHRPNKGLCATLNEALSWCQGKYVSMFASDDMMLPQKSSIQVAYLENNPEITSVFANMEFFDGGTILKVTNNPAKEHTFQDILVFNNLLAPTQVSHLSAIQKVDGYDETIMIEDYYMWLKLLNNSFRIQSIDDVLVKYRWHGNNTPSNTEKMIPAEKQILDLYKNHPFYHKAIYLRKRNKIKLYRDNGQKAHYYFLKNLLMLKFYLFGKI